MTVPCIEACSPWTIADDVGKFTTCDLDGVDPEIVDWAISVATDLLFVRSGRQFPGSCKRTVRPCAQRRPGHEPPWQDFALSRGVGMSWDGSVVFDPALGVVGGPWAPPLFSGVEWSQYGFCGCSDGCGCHRLQEVQLGVNPLTAIEEALVDGVAVPMDEMRIDDWRWLVRLPNSNGVNLGWPVCQALDKPPTESGTFQVTATYGQTPPSSGKAAAEEMACQLIKSRIGSKDCKLPERVRTITRQGMTVQFAVVLDNFKILTESGLTGLGGVVDLFLSTYNPKGLTRRAAVLRPRRVVRRTSPPQAGP